MKTFPQLQHMFLVVYSLSSAEGHLKVLSAIGGAQGVVVKRFGKETVHKGAKRHTVAPAGWEVLNVHVLRQKQWQKKKNITKAGKLYPGLFQLQLQWVVLKEE